MSAGLATCMIAGLTFLPALLTLLTRPEKRKRPSIDNARSTLGREEPEVNNLKFENRINKSGFNVNTEV